MKFAAAEAIAAAVAWPGAEALAAMTGPALDLSGWPAAAARA